MNAVSISGDPYYIEDDDLEKSLIRLMKELG